MVKTQGLKEEHRYPTMFSTGNKTLVPQQGIKIPEEKSNVSWNKVAVLPLRWSCMNLVKESLKSGGFLI